MRMLLSRRTVRKGAFATALAAVTATSAFGQNPSSAATPQVVTTGTGEVQLSPDRATVIVGVQSRATTVSQATADNSRRQRAIIDTLRALGLGSDQINTVNFNVSPEMQYPPNQSPRVTGYIVTNTVRASLRRVEDVGRTIDAALAKGANEVSGVEFTSSRADSARRAAIAEAVAHARADAETMAKAAGGSLGQLLEVASGVEPIRPFEATMARARVAGAAPTPIEPGQLTVTATVTARWTFVPNR
ncbi:MAG TPA: SIMPL domain-containing protein [Gemmatimonadaceae bacterium]|nr:SIMPL domain-containing protein [Gemmatimonadaceae bacterium]